MSVEAQAIALNHSRASTAIAKLVLIGIANHDGDGGAYPAVATLARYAACTPRSVQNALRELEHLGEVRRHVQQGGDRNVADYARPNLYEFLLTCPPDCDGSKNHRTRRRRSIQVDLDDLQAPLGPVDKPGAADSPGETASGGPGEARAPKPVPGNHNKRPADQPPTARPRVTHSAWDRACVDGKMTTHVPRRTTGKCAYCGASRTYWEEEL